MRSVVATRRIDMSPVASAPSNSAVCPMFTTASASEIVDDNVVLDFSVLVSVSGTQAIIDGSSAQGNFTTSPDALAVTPPTSEAATLSGCPSNSVLCCSNLLRAAPVNDASAPFR